MLFPQSSLHYLHHDQQHYDRYEFKFGNDLEEGKLYDMTNIDGTQSIAPHLLSQ